MSRFETTDSREVYRGRARVRIDTVESPAGTTVEREIVEPYDSVVIVPLLGDGDVVLVRQYRHATGGELLELPAGTLDVEGETALEAARRELSEEAGLGGGSLVEVGTFWVTPGWATERATVVIARDVAPVGTPDEFEPKAEERHMEVVRLPLQAAVSGVHEGAIVDATTALGLLIAASLP